MKLLRSAALALLLLVATLGVLAAWTRSAGALAQARIPLILAATAFYSAGSVVFSAIWALLLSGLRSGRTAAGPVRMSHFRAFRVGVVSLAGLLTPMNIATDVLRSMLGRRYLGVDLASTAAASIVTRESKLHVTLVLLPVVVAATGVSATEHRGRMLGALAGLLALALVLAAFRSDVARSLARSLGIGHLAETTRELHRQISWGTRGAVYLVFAAGFAAEWEALRLCFQALGVPPDVGVTLAAYATLFFLSRTPVVPLGIGIMEGAGLAWLRMVHVPLEQAGAIIVLWSGLRVVVPHLLAAASFATFACVTRT